MTSYFQMFVPTLWILPKLTKFGQIRSACVLSEPIESFFENVLGLSFCTETAEVLKKLELCRYLGRESVTLTVRVRSFQ